MSLLVLYFIFRLLLLSGMSHNSHLKKNIRNTLLIRFAQNIVKKNEKTPFQQFKTAIFGNKPFSRCCLTEIILKFRKKILYNIFKQ